ncbi:YhjD/YihY/BrkB family envelope integrity protein [uncultured Jatrophihabitans sp.]|uniref:YhjD/YihY/BrkB family envelope integrity protein n=1 Tax=uncultured Jatrophihabitans sp. TaxID=1610747 RepID=UPI0035CAD638
MGSRAVSLLREIAGGLRDRARRSDVMVVAAALTCYAAFGLVPLLAIGTRVAAGVYGSSRVVGAAQFLARYVPGALHLDRSVVAFARSASGAPWWTALLALLPVSLYAEGTVRSLERFSRAPERRSRAIRGRTLTPVLVVLAMLAVVLTAGPLRPLLDDPFGRGLGARLLGVFVAFNLLFFLLFPTLLLVYRLFASTPLRRGPLVAGAFVSASWISGQLLGYLIALRHVGGFDRAFGHYAPAGEVAAFAFLVYLENLVFLLGYLLALVLHERPPRSGRADRPRDDRGRQRDERKTATRVGRTADQEQPARE